MTVLIKTKHGVYVNLNNVFSIDFALGQGKSAQGDDIGSFSLILR